MTKIVLLIASMFQLVGCSSPSDLLFKTLPKEGWVQDQWVTFSHRHHLPEKEVSLDWILRHDNDYPFSNIHLIVNWRNPKGIEGTDTLSYMLAQPNGKWLGKGLYIKEHLLPFSERFMFNAPGIYQFRIRPAVRATDMLVADSILQGIHQIGLVINPISNE